MAKKTTLSDHLAGIFDDYGGRPGYKIEFLVELNDAADDLIEFANVHVTPGSYTQAEIQERLNSFLTRGLKHYLEAARHLGLPPIELSPLLPTIPEEFAPTKGIITKPVSRTIEGVRYLASFQKHTDGRWGYLVTVPDERKVLGFIEGDKTELEGFFKGLTKESL